MSYLDFSNAELFALTRQRRAERAQRQPCEVHRVERGPRREVALQRWKKRQWKMGNRRCGYCARPIFTQGKLIDFRHPQLATVDHRIPWSQDGPDDPSNWLMCCRRCNDAKGDMSEETFRSSVLPGLVAGDYALARRA